MQKYSHLIVLYFSYSLQKIYLRMKLYESKSADFISNRLRLSEAEWQLLFPIVV